MSLLDILLVAFVSAKSGPILGNCILANGRKENELKSDIKDVEVSWEACCSRAVNRLIFHVSTTSGRTWIKGGKSNPCYNTQTL